MIQERQTIMSISIRKFEKRDIPAKVNWINNPKNNAYLHYDIPLNIKNTVNWFENNKDRIDRYDAVIEVDGKSVGLIGLLGIDVKNKKAEYYIVLGDRDYLGKGVAKSASKILLNYAFKDLGLNRIYLYTEVENISAIKLYDRIGFKREGILKNDLFSKGRFVDRYIYGITKDDYYHRCSTPIFSIAEINQNNLYVKREDFIPFSFGGNKARKAQLYFDVIDNGNFDCVVTYGSSSSNHCRIVANMAAARKMSCYIVSPEEASKNTYNTDMMKLFGAEFTVCPVNKVHDTIESILIKLKEKGHNPYFIAGGGHGNIGTQAYVNCYEEIRRYESDNNIKFDYIFHTSGTGTTQAGLVCGKLINRDEKEIIGISIARRNPKGRNVIVDSVKDYLSEQKVNVTDGAIEEATIFVDDYVGEGYSTNTPIVENIIKTVITQYGIPLDSTYTGKAFAGMLDYINKNSIIDKNILFIHTGGTPLFFDSLNNLNL